MNKYLHWWTSWSQGRARKEKCSTGLHSKRRSIFLKPPGLWLPCSCWGFELLRWDSAGVWVRMKQTERFLCQDENRRVLLRLIWHSWSFTVSLSTNRRQTWTFEFFKFCFSKEQRQCMVLSPKTINKKVERIQTCKSLIFTLLTRD